MAKIIAKKIPYGSAGVAIEVTAGSNITQLKYSAVVIGNVVIIEGQFTGSITTANPIFTVPANYVPSGYKFGSGFVKHSNGVVDMGYYELNTNGELRQQMASSVTSGSFVIVYTI